MRSFILGIMILIIIACSEPTAPNPPTARSEMATGLVTMTYNIAHGGGDLARIAGIINSVNPDVVALQEVDRNTRRSGNVDQAAALGSLTGMTAIFGRAIDFDGGQYGNAILVRHPHTVVGNYPLPGNEARAVLLVDVAWQGSTFTFAATHLDNSDPADRLASVNLIERILRERDPQHTILGGDLNDTIGSPTLDAFSVNWTPPVVGASTYPSWDPTRQIDYILHRGGAWSILESRVLSHPEASDHLPVLTTLTLDTAVAPAPWPPSPVTLTASATVSKSQLRVNLSWAGASTLNVDVYRNGKRVTTTPNDGAHAETLRTRDGSSFEYQLCEAGSYVCSNKSTVGF